MDLSVQPPSYGIEIGGSYRETEGTRLSPLPAQPQRGQREEQKVEGLGHRDAETEAKEAAVAALEQ